MDRKQQAKEILRKIGHKVDDPQNDKIYQRMVKDDTFFEDMSYLTDNPIKAAAGMALCQLGYNVDDSNDLEARFLHDIGIEDKQFALKLWNTARALKGDNYKGLKKFFKEFLFLNEYEIGLLESVSNPEEVQYKQFINTLIKAAREKAVENVPQAERGYKFSQSQSKKGSKQRARNGLEPEERKKRDKKLFDDFKEAKAKNSNITPHGFCERNSFRIFSEYNLKPTRARQIITDRLRS